MHIPFPEKLIVEHMLLTTDGGVLQHAFPLYLLGVHGVPMPEWLPVTAGPLIAVLGKVLPAPEPRKTRETSDRPYQKI